MTDRTISVRLKAEVADFQRQMGAATKSLDSLAKASGDSAGAATTTMGKLVQSARLQSETWREVGGGMMVAGAAITGVTVAVAKTGIEYNTLQQKSRAALTTLMGGAREANAQMDKLDDFARTSPFSKAVFIQAQQQMLGFGIEARKVVPYLSAINEAIAATGGNNNDLSEIVRIFSQVQAAAKITATDLMQFGQRGIDAATLIGSQMGMTGAQIREQITDGSLDAGAALDALAAGMQERFAGASAGVKNTMEGAFDRVKAAWRDLSASLTEGAVGQEGGGWLVGLTNQTADFLRWMDGLPDPVKNAAAAMGGLTGAGLLAGGAFIALVPQIASTVTAVRTLSATFPALTAAAGPAGLALLAVGGLAATIATDMATYAREVEEYASALDLGDGAEEAQRNLAAQALAAKGVASALEELGVQQTLATDAALGDADARQAIVDAYDNEIQRRRDLADAAVAEGNMWSEDAQIADSLIAKRDEVVTAIDKEIEKRGQSAEAVAEESALLGANAEVSEDAAAAKRDVTASTTPFTDALKDEAAALNGVVDALQGYYGLAISASGAQIALEAAFDAATEAAEENGATLDITTDAGRANQEALDDIARSALDAAGAMVENGASADELRDTTQRARDAFIKTAQSMGATADEAAALADKYGLIPTKVSTTITVKADLSGYYDANRVLNSIAGKTVSAYVAIKTYGQGAVATGGYGADVAAAVGLAGGGMARRSFSQGSVVDGPGTTTSDSIAAWLSRKEFVTRAAAVDYYGTDVMYAMNAKRIPREVFAPLGYADGGAPTHTYAPARLAGGGMAASGPSTAGAPVGDTYHVNLEGREALQWVMTHMDDGRRRSYQGEAVHV